MLLLHEATIAVHGCAAASITRTSYDGLTFSSSQLKGLQALMQATPDGQQTTNDRRLMMNALQVRQNQTARVLIFGCGRDSSFWAHTMNPRGKTVFLEDNVTWAKAQDADLDVHVVKYSTAPMAAWEERLASPAGKRTLAKKDEPLLEIQGVPSGLFDEWWDVILVDAPAGFNGRMPGRMAPIFQTSRIIERQRTDRPCKPVDVFVHDFNRPIERVWSLMFLTPHMRILNYAELSQSKQRRTTGSPNATFLAWFHTP